MISLRMITDFERKKIKMLAIQTVTFSSAAALSFACFLLEKNQKLAKLIRDGVYSVIVLYFSLVITICAFNID